MMAGVPLTTLRERLGPNGKLMLTGKLGDAVLVGLLEETGADRAWRLIIAEPLKRPKAPRKASEADHA